MIIGALIEIVFIRWLVKTSVLRLIIHNYRPFDCDPGSGAADMGEMCGTPLFHGDRGIGIVLTGIHLAPGIVGDRDKLCNSKSPKPLLQLYPPGRQMRACSGKTVTRQDSAASTPGIW